MEDDYSTDQFKATQVFDDIVWHLRANLAVKTNRKDLVLTAENSFHGKEAVEFLLLEIPRIVPGNVPNREKMAKLMEMMLEWKIIAEAFPKKNQKRRFFSENRIYIFLKTLDELKKPKPRSRRSASFSGARNSAKVVPPSSPSGTFNRAPKVRMSRRLSRSNGNVNKIGTDPSGVDNHAFDETSEENGKPKEMPSLTKKPLNRSLESICKVVEPEENPDRKERMYDWLPFFKSKRFAEKAKQRRSVSLDRNHCVVAKEKEEEANKIKATTPPIQKEQTVFLHPKGPLPPDKYRSSVPQFSEVPMSRGRMYESIMRRSSVVPVDPVTTNRDSSVWKTELISRLGRFFDYPLPQEWSARIDANDIQWNTQEIDTMDGIVKSRCSGAQLDYPQSVIQFMDYLGRYPFSSSKRNELVPEHDVRRIFSTLVNRLEDLNAPLNSVECSLIVNLLCKMESFSEMIDSGAARRRSRVMPAVSASSIEEVGLMAEGFARDLVGVRASRHRRRALSPPGNRINVEIQEEKAYKIREQWLLESIQFVLLALPTARRRKLHKFVLFIKSISTNEVFDIADPSNGSSNNREAAIIGLWTGVCGGYRKFPGILITAVLLANYRALFNVPDEFVDQVRRLELRSESKDGLYEKVSRGRRARRQPVGASCSTPVAKKTVEKEAEKAKKGLLTRLLRK